MLPRQSPLFFCSEWAGENLRSDRPSLIAAHFATRLSILLDSVPLCLPVWQVVSLGCGAAGAKIANICAEEKSIETCAGNDRGWIDAAAPRTSDAAPFGAGQRWQHGNAGHGDP